MSTANEKGIENFENVLAANNNIVQDIKSDGIKMRKELISNSNDEKKDRIMGYCDNMIDNMLVMVNKLIDAEFQNVNEEDKKNHKALKDEVKKNMTKKLHSYLSGRVGDSLAIIEKHSVVIANAILAIPTKAEEILAVSIPRVNMIPVGSRNDNKRASILYSLHLLFSHIQDTLN